MNRLAAGLFGDLDDLCGVEIGGRADAAQPASLVAAQTMERSRVVLRKDDDRANAELGGRARDADGDLAAIGDQKLPRSHRPH
jgi:hypothetical protein